MHDEGHQPPPPVVGDGRYQLQEVIGEGGMARVWRAVDTKLHVDRAIKIINGEGRALKVRARRLTAEARAMARVQHPHIVRVHDIVETDTGPIIVMDYVSGGTLEDRLQKRGPLAPRQAVVWIVQILGALHAAHQRSVVHRDVKPSNILLDDQDQAMLADFGIALLSDEERHTRTGVTMGSVAYMAPEQRLDAKTVEPAADVYSAGSTLYHLLTDATPVDLFTADEHSPRWLDVPEPLRPLLQRATRLDPRQRFVSAKDFAEALVDVLEQVPDAAGTPEGWAHALRLSTAGQTSEGRSLGASAGGGSLGGTLAADATEADEGQRRTALLVVAMLCIVGVGFVGVVVRGLGSAPSDAGIAVPSEQVFEPAVPALPGDVPTDAPVPSAEVAAPAPAPAPRASPPSEDEGGSDEAADRPTARAPAARVVAPAPPPAAVDAAQPTRGTADLPVAGRWRYRDATLNVTMSLAGRPEALSGIWSPGGDEDRDVALRGRFDPSTRRVTLSGEDEYGVKVQLEGAYEVGADGTERLIGQRLDGAGRTLPIRFVRKP